MAYQVLALKWRPKSFSDVVGQAHVTQTLLNAFSKDRIAQAYLFTGPRGVGKTTAARILAAGLNCQNDSTGTPCDTCNNCLEIANSRNMDVLEIDGASNRGIEEIRNLRELIKYAPINSKYKIFIIDEVHMLTGPAFNALLKTLEEPPAHGKFILATTDIHKVPPTIISRCQRYDFNRITVADISDRLKEILAAEKIECDAESIQAVARKADGSMRDGLSYLDQLIAYCGDAINYEDAIKVLGIIPHDLHFNLLAAILSKSSADAIRIISEIQSSGVPVVDFLSGFNRHLRNMLYASIPNGIDSVELGSDLKERYLAEASRYDHRDLLRIANILLDLGKTVRQADQPYMILEIAVLKLLEMDSSISIDQVLSGIPAGPPGVSRPVKITDPPKPVPAVSKPAPEPHPEVVVPTRPEPVEVPKPEKIPEPTPVSVNLDLSALQSKWNLIVADMLKASASIGNLLEQSQVQKVDGNRLTIGVTGASKFNLSRIEKKKEQLEAIIEKFFNTSVRTQYISIDEPVPVKMEMTPELTDEPENQGEAVVDRLIELFDGEQLR